MPKQIVTLKLDFKIDDRGILRIVDLGDAFGSDHTGFEDANLETKMLNDIHEATGASIATIFGELPIDAMQPESINIPLVLRQPALAGGSFDTHDLPPDITILPYSHQGRLASYLSHIWGKQKPNTLVAPAGLIAAEMHKGLWYFLMQKHIASDKQTKFLFWNNDTNPAEINLKEIDLQHGVFIKIADRSTGGTTGEVFYAGDENEILIVAADLHEKYNKSEEQFKKHLFVIEPAYTTTKQHQNKNYNVTGRAFISISYDQAKKSFDVKIAAAKWMFPLEPVTKKHTSKQMISNVTNNIKMQSLTAEELEQLSSEIQQTYRKTFEAGFENINLFDYLKDHTDIKKLESCLRFDSAYSLMLRTFYGKMNITLSSLTK